MSNYILKNGSVVISQPMTKGGAEKRLEELKNIYPSAVIVPTDEGITERPTINVEAEEVEDVGCSGGGCTL